MVDYNGLPYRYLTRIGAEYTIKQYMKYSSKNLQWSYKQLENQFVEEVAFEVVEIGDN